MNRRQAFRCTIAIVPCAKPMLAVAQAQAQAPASTAEVVKVDKEAGRITLKHNGIKALDVPPMSLVFRVSNPQMLNDVAAGDRVRFTAARVDGQYTLTAITKAP
jgi:Cu(I)/Ag(I) efflux system periplasmic protein CusF